MSIGPIQSVFAYQNAQQLSEIQLAAAAKMMKISSAQSQAVVELIEAAAQNIEQVSAELGQMIDQLA